MMLAAEIVDQSVGTYAVGALVVGALGAFAYLVRNAFESTTKAVEGLGVKLDAMSVVIAQHDGDRRVLEARLSSLERTVERVERELSEGVAR